MRATAIAHPNIALVKYWGKGDAATNIPAVGSISITLDSLTTTTTVVFSDEFAEDRFTLNGRLAPAALDRVQRAVDLVAGGIGLRPHFEIESSNNFPTAAGLASSASGFAALVTAADHALGIGHEPQALADLARQCSGSAARSIFGGFVELELVAGRSATTVRQILARDEWPLAVAIAVTSDAEKHVGSTVGMELTRRTSPFYGAWVAVSDADLGAARTAIAGRDFEAIAAVAEASCLKMHAVAMSANPGIVYWNGATVECLHRVRDLRHRGTSVFFTIDAGPQVKAVCEPGECAHVARVLEEIPGVIDVLTCGLGDGARMVED